MDGIEHCFNPKDLFKKLLNDRNIKYKDSYEKIITKHGIIETKTQIVKFNNIGDDEFNHNLLTKVMTDFINKIGSSDVVYLHDILFSNEYDENIGCYIYKLEYNLYIQKNN